MSGNFYPEGVDCVWLASDRNGYVAAFVTAGVGPIPFRALDQESVPIRDIESLICEMPVISQAHLLVSIKRPDDFIDLAQRGIYVYDWSDVHRTTLGSLHGYELVAIPDERIKASALPAVLCELALELTFNLFFADYKQLDVCKYASCKMSKSQDTLISKLGHP